MATKIGPLNQHQVLHEYYGLHDCCLCVSEKAVEKLHNDLETMRQERDRAREECGHEKHMRRSAGDERDRWIKKWIEHQKSCHNPRATDD